MLERRAVDGRARGTVCENFTPGAVTDLKDLAAALAWAHGRGGVLGSGGGFLAADRAVIAIAVPLPRRAIGLVLGFGAGR